MPKKAVASAKSEPAKVEPAKVDVEEDELAEVGG
jgi:hypothetical protein